MAAALAWHIQKTLLRSEVAVPDIPGLTDTVAIVLAGGQGGGLHELTRRENQAALPFARFHRIVDFTMAALARSGVGRVIVATGNRSGTLAAHLREVWAPVWANGGLTLRDDLKGDAADILRACAAGLDRIGTREVLVLAADQVHAMNCGQFMASHRAGCAPITVAAMPVARAEASRFDIVTEGPGRRIAGLAGKPTRPAALPGDPRRSLASPGIYAISWPWLRDLLDDPRMRGFGEDVVSHAVNRGEAAVWRWEGYWRDVTTLDGFRTGWLDFEGPAPPCRRPFVPGMQVSPGERLSQRDQFHASLNMGGLQLLSPLVGGDDPGRWTALDRSVLMPGARVSPGVRLSDVIVAPGAVMPQGMQIGEDPEEDRRWFRVSGGTTLVTSAMLARRGAMRAPVFPLFAGRQGLMRKVRGAR